MNLLTCFFLDLLSNCNAVQLLLTCLCYRCPIESSNLPCSEPFVAFRRITFPVDTMFGLSGQVRSEPGAMIVLVRPHRERLRVPLVPVPRMTNSSLSKAFPHKLRSPTLGVLEREIQV